MSTAEKTKAQGAASGGSVSGRASLASRKIVGLTNKKIRELRADPTVKLGREFIVGPALEAGWSIEADDGVPDEARDLVDRMLSPLHDFLMETSILGMCDFGWQAYEVVLETKNGRVVLKKLKALYHDVTSVLVDEYGTFRGIKNRDVILEPDYCFFVSQGVEGTEWYGTSDMESVWKAMEPYGLNEAAAEQYDRKVSGTHFIVYYPAGTTESFNGQVDVDNFYVAEALLNALEASGRIAIPRLKDIAPELEEQAGWKIELLTDAGAGGGYLIQRAGYLDTLKARAFGVPERSILEGKYGTLAEAETHGDIAVININRRRRNVCTHVNWHLVNRILRLNYGERYENKVRLTPNPLNDQALAYYRRLLDALIAGQNGMELVDQIDSDALLERVKIPVRQLQVPPTPTPTPEPESKLSSRLKAMIRKTVGR